MAKRENNTEKPTKSEARYEREAIDSRHREDERSPLSKGPPGSATGGVHAAGEPAGGSAIGGLAGSNAGHGDPELDQLEEAGGSSEFDHQLEEQDEPAYSGRAGGAVGGSPANKRVAGGRTHGGIAPGASDRGDSTVGGDPKFRKDQPHKPK